MYMVQHQQVYFCSHKYIKGVEQLYVYFEVNIISFHVALVTNTLLDTRIHHDSIKQNCYILVSEVHGLTYVL